MKIFVVLFSILLIIGLGYSSYADKMLHKKHTTHKSTQEAQKKLVKCPVTGGIIDPAKAYAKTVHKGKTYYFCCAGCPEQFKKNPERYLKK